MRMLVLPRYDVAGASSRMRMYQYLPALRSAGMEVTVSPLFDSTYVRSLYAGRIDWRAILSGYSRRLMALTQTRSFDVVWVEKELLPWLPAFVERLPGRAAVVVDIDDAVFHRYDLHVSWVVRRLLGRRVDAIMRRADLVTAGNSYLVSRASAAGCRWVESLPTVIDLDRYPAPTPKPEGAVKTIGWIGSPSTAPYLRAISQVVEELGRHLPIQAFAIGARTDQLVGTPFVAMPWSEDTEVSDISGFDIGVMPLPDEPWERGKCGYKLIQYMACGLPVVASPVGVNAEIVTDDVNGLLSESAAQWHASLTQLVGDRERRLRFGAEGRKRVEDWYSLQAQAPRFVSMIKELVRRRLD